jgi:pyruvate dehydrogenase E2 component (dihydrolipoamide acetyltransferase)
MAKIVALTQLSPTMSEGTLSKWKKNEGDKVTAGDVLAEVETDKANMELESFDKGTLLKRLVGEGATVKVGAPIAILGTPGEDYAALLAGANGGSKAAAPAAPATPPTPALPPSGGGGKERVFASPLARTIAKERGIDVATVQGSGPSGRVVKRDVENAVPAAPSFASGFSGPEFEDVPMSPMRRTIARRLVESKQKIPHFYLTIECDAGPIKAFRAQANEGVADDAKVSLNDVLVKCVARALRQVPNANASIVEKDGTEVFRRWKRVHVGVAVALEDGLITPVVRDADERPLTDLARVTKDLIARARTKKLKPEEYTGGTISISNLGMYGIEEFSAIVNPPESTILAVGAIAPKPVVAADGKTIVVQERMRMTLSCDHRIVDGSLGAQLLEKIKNLVEHPLKAVI